VKGLRRALGLLGLAAAVTGAVLLARRLVFRRRERIDLYYEDGAMLSFEQGSPLADRLLALAHDALRAAGEPARP
jgi:hypothetical protein